MATVQLAPVGVRFENLVLDFLAYLEFERGLSRNTLEAYRSDLLQFGHFLVRNELDPSQVCLPALVLPPPAPRGPA